MRIALLVVFISLLVLMVLTYPLKVKFALHVNVKDDVGFGAIKFMHLKLFCARFKISKTGKLEVNSAIKKKKKKKNKQIRRKYFLCLMKVLQIRKFEIFLDVGGSQNASSVALACGYVSAIFSSIIAVLMNQYKGIKTFMRINPSYEETRLELSGSIVLSICALDIILSFVCAISCYVKSKIKEKLNG